VVRNHGAGTLYGAKATQTSAESGGSFDIEWIELGSHSQEEVKVGAEKSAGIEYAGL